MKTNGMKTRTQIVDKIANLKKELKLGKDYDEALGIVAKVSILRWVLRSGEVDE